MCTYIGHCIARKEGCIDKDELLPDCFECEDNCCHGDTYLLPEPWPTGDTIEVCNCCGASRAHWEQGESGWCDINLFDGRARIEESLDLGDTVDVPQTGLKSEGS